MGDSSQPRSAPWGIGALVLAFACAGPDALGPENGPPTAGGRTARADGAELLSFQTLGTMDYSPPTAGTPADQRAPLPPEMSALDGRRVEVEGFVVPIEIRSGVVSRLSLCHQLWFGGLMPESWANEILIELDPENVLPSLPTDRVRFRGTLRVGERLDRNGGVAHVYRLDGARLVGSPVGDGRRP